MSTRTGRRGPSPISSSMPPIGAGERNESRGAGDRAGGPVRVVFGSRDEAGGLTPGAIVGGGGKELDLALDPLEGRGVVARGGNGAMSMTAVGEPGHFTTLPDIYMRKMAVGPRARGAIDLLRPVGDNIEAIAEAFGRRVNDVTTIVLDRPRHHDLMEEIRNSGARINMIQDGDVQAAISRALR